MAQAKTSRSASSAPWPALTLVRPLEPDGGGHVPALLDVPWLPEPAFKLAGSAPSPRQGKNENEVVDAEGSRRVKGHCIVDAIISNHQCTSALYSPHKVGEEWRRTAPGGALIFEHGLFPLDSQSDCGGRRCRFPGQFCAESPQGTGCANSAILSNPILSDTDPIGSR